MSDLITRINEKSKLPVLDLDLQARVSYEVQLQLVAIIQVYGANSRKPISSEDWPADNTSQLRISRRHLKP